MFASAACLRVSSCPEQAEYYPVPADFVILFNSLAACERCAGFCLALERSRSAGWRRCGVVLFK